MHFKKDGYEIRPAAASDAAAITMLYHEIYGGDYPDPMMRDISLMKKFFQEERGLWVVIARDNHIVGATVFELDRRHRLAKAFGAVVLPEHQSRGLMELAVEKSQEYLVNETHQVDIVYATTRTRTIAPQRVLRRMGFKNLGIFPNVHKTDEYETHCLTAWFAPRVLEAKCNEFKLHPCIAPLYDIARKDCNLPEIPIAPPEEYRDEPGAAPLPPLELIDAPEFVQFRFQQLQNEHKLITNFYPFHQPNVLISSPNQQVEVFAYVSKTDRHCTIIGVKDPGELNFGDILDETTRLLRETNVRYVELLVRVTRLRVIDHIYNSSFVPCAYFPAFQLHEGARHDFIIFSKTFEVLNFENLQFEDINREFAAAYYKSWKTKAVASIL